MTDAILVLCTCPRRDQCRPPLCEQLLDQRLAACINQLPRVTSVYRWQGRRERTREIQLVIKSRAALFEPLRQCILAHHPYEVPGDPGAPGKPGPPCLSRLVDTGDLMTRLSPLSFPC